MKKIYFCCFAAVALIFSACQSTMVDDLSEQTMPMTRAITSFDACTDCILSSGAEVSLPWVAGAKTTTPGDINIDVKAADGWKILMTTVDFKDYSKLVKPINCVSYKVW